MFFYDCERGYVPDDGQNDVTDGSVDNYDFDWDEETAAEPVSIAPEPGEEAAVVPAETILNDE